MNVYEKLNQARMMFQSMNVKKSGYNKYANYYYFELSDILPAVNKICEEVKATCVVSFCDEYAELLFVNSEKIDEQIRFTSPMSIATLKGCHEVQNLGAVETYLKRYLYQNCFEIAESDTLDATMQPNNNNVNTGKNTGKNVPNNTPQKWNNTQLAELNAVLSTNYPDGNPVFSREDRDVYNMLYNECADFATSLKQAKSELEKALKEYKPNSKPEIPPDDLF